MRQMMEHDGIGRRRGRPGRSEIERRRRRAPPADAPLGRDPALPEHHRPRPPPPQGDDAGLVPVPQLHGPPGPHDLHELRLRPARPGRVRAGAGTPRTPRTATASSSTTGSPRPSTCRGKTVLEVGSGRGGGAAFVAKYLRPKSMIGIDYADRSVRFCRRAYELPNLSFAPGDAEHMPFDDASFDVVLNVESSHCYPDMARFVAEAARVLRPAGRLLFADMRHRSAMESRPPRPSPRPAWSSSRSRRSPPTSCGPWSWTTTASSSLIDREVPRIFRPMFRCFAGWRGPSRTSPSPPASGSTGDSCSASPRPPRARPPSPHSSSPTTADRRQPGPASARLGARPHQPS